MLKSLLNLALSALVIVPFGVAVAPIALLSGSWWVLAAVLVAPVTFIASYCGICILFARFTKRAIIPGKFPRDMAHPIYGPRRIYGTMWTAIYYFKPLYWLLLTNDVTKKMLLRGFGYQGPIGMTVYPDTWIRDLPLLKLGENAYLANRATIGTNLVMSDGNILVDEIHVGKRSVVGHLAIIGIGARIGEFTDFGLSSATGIRVKIGNRVHISPRSDLNHGCFIGDGVKIGSSSYVGVKAQITGQDLDIPAYANIPGGSIITSQEDVENTVRKESLMLSALRDELLNKVRTVV